MSGVPLTSESPYRVLLRQPQVRWQAVSGLLAQVTQGASGVGIILVIRQHAGSVALAGGVVGALYVAAGLAGPLQGRLIDRRGAAGVVAATGAGHAAALAAIVLLAAVPAPAAALVTLGAAAGIFLPPISTVMRVDWGEQLGAGDRTAAYSLVYLVQEVAPLAGPVVLATVVAVASASAAVLVIAGITGVGARWFASSAESLVPAAAERTTAKALVLRSGGVRFLVSISVLLGAGSAIAGAVSPHGGSARPAFVVAALTATAAEAS